MAPGMTESSGPLNTRAGGSIFRTVFVALLSGAFGSVLTLFAVFASNEKISATCPPPSLFVDPQLHGGDLPAPKCPICRCDCATWAKPDKNDENGGAILGTALEGEMKEKFGKIHAEMDQEIAAAQLGYRRMVASGSEIRESKKREGGRKFLVNYAHRCCKEEQKLNCESGLKFGVDECRMHGLHSMDSDFIKENRAILAREKGSGLWLWKPYIILRTLMDLRPGDLLIYSDSDLEILGPLDPLFELAKEQDIVPFETRITESEGTKRDAFFFMSCDEDRFIRSPQRLGSYMVFRKSMRSVQFVVRWLEFATDARIITDDGNESGLPNYGSFVAHHFDQSVFSLLSKRWGLKAWPDAGEEGEEAREMEGVKWGQIIGHIKGRKGARSKGKVKEEGGEVKGKPQGHKEERREAERDVMEQEDEEHEKAWLP